MEDKIDYENNMERDAKNKKFQEMYKNVNFALQEIMNEARVIGVTQDLNTENFPHAINKVKINKEMDSYDQTYCQDDEKVFEINDTKALQSDKIFKSFNVFSRNCHIHSKQNQNCPPLNSLKCQRLVNLKFKNSKSFKEDSYNRKRSAANFDTNKCLTKYPPLESKKRPRHFPDYKISQINMKPNSHRVCKCNKPSCCLTTLHSGNFKKHSVCNFQQKVGERTNHVIQRKSILKRGRCGFENVENNRKCKNVLQYFEGANKTSRVNKTVKCSLCNFFCISSSGMKRHYRRYHSYNKIRKSSEEMNCEEFMNSSDQNLNDEDQLDECSFCTPKSHSSSLMRKQEQQKHHHVVDEEFAVTFKKFKCFECDFETPHRITLVRHEKGHANFVNKAKIKYNNNNNNTKENYNNTSIKDTFKQRERLAANLSDFQNGYKLNTFSKLADITKNNSCNCCHCPLISRNEVETHQQVSQRF